MFLNKVSAVNEIVLNAKSDVVVEQPKDQIDVVATEKKVAVYINDLLGVLKPDVFIAGVWRDVQPNPATMKRVFSANPSVKVFTTNLTQNNIATMTSNGVDVSKFVATGGHVVIRVCPGGASYYVFVLDDSDSNYRVAAVYGPFACK